MDLVLFFKKMAEVLMQFFKKIIESFFPRLNPHQPQSTSYQASSAPSSSSSDTVVLMDQHQQNHIPPVVAEAARQNVPRNLDWAMLLIGFCLTSSVDFALQSLQSNLPLCFHFLSFSILLAFVFLLASKFINSNSRMLSEALERTGIFFASTAFFLAMTTTYPPYLKLISWVIYALAVLAIIICEISSRKIF